MNYLTNTSPCPECGRPVSHDAELGPQPCGDACWLAEGLRDLLDRRGQALSEDEIHAVLQRVLDEQSGRAGEHPASVALHDLGEAYRAKAKRWSNGGDRASALLISGVLGDLEHVRGML